MLHLGILAHSADGAALCLLEAIREGARRLGPHDRPEITLSILPMAPTLAAYDTSDLARVRSHLTQTAARLAAAGCDFFVCPDNTAHLALEHETPALAPLPIPGLHIGEVVARKAAVDGRRRVGLLGTRWTMNGPVYRDAFARAGVGMIAPSVTDQVAIHKIIFEELCRGVTTDRSRAAMRAIIDRLKGEGCDAVALCCTELPLLISPSDSSSLPTLDSTRLLAHAGLAIALGDGTLPGWRGGRLAG